MKTIFKVNKYWVTLRVEGNKEKDDSFQEGEDTEEEQCRAVVVMWVNGMYFKVCIDGKG